MISPQKRRKIRARIKPTEDESSIPKKAKYM